jgi:putative DNA primase/helicase
MTISFDPQGQAPGREDPSPVEEWPSPDRPLEVAYALADERERDGVYTLQSWRGGWWEYDGSSWREVEEVRVANWIYNRLRNVWYLGPPKKQNTDGDEGQPVLIEWKPTPRKVQDVMHCYGVGVALLDGGMDSGSWIKTGSRRPGIVATPAGLFDVKTRTTHPAHPGFFSTWALPYSYDPEAGRPAAWVKFLHSIMPGDPGGIDMLQEWMGYVISGRTDHQKAMALIGKPRSGKGTILKVMEALVGAENTVSPTLASMTTQFGLENAVGKALFAIGDARISGQTSTLVERLLSITGEDSITVDRKHRTAWTGRLPGRIMIASNDPLDFRDASGAIGSRFLTVQTPVSFLGREDFGLQGRLMAELPAIMKWALDGLDRLTKRGRFLESETSKAAGVEMHDTGSPVTQFVEAACAVGDGEAFYVPTAVLFGAWEVWRKANGYGQANIRTFGRQLKAAFEFRPVKKGTDVREAGYLGIALRQEFVEVMRSAYLASSHHDVLNDKLIARAAQVAM